LIISPGVAMAASIYDQAYRVTNSISLSNTASGSRGACVRLDYSTNWATLFDQASNPHSGQQAVISDLKNSYSIAVESGRIGVSMFDVSSDGYSGIHIFWTEDSSLILNWEGNQNWSTVMPSGNNVKSIAFVTQAVWLGNSNCNPYVPFALSLRPLSTDSSGDYKNFFVNTNSPNYPNSYEGELVRTEPPAAKYVAGGDSFSSGDGNELFEYGTDVSTVNGCHRSTLAYPRLLQNELDMPTAFVACSGATTANVVGGQWNEPAQIDALSDDTEIVTLTIGGNDVQFIDFVLACSWDCGQDTTVYDAMMDRINDPDFKANLVATYKTILNAAPEADLYVGDYPYLSAENAGMCVGLDFSTAREVQTALNNVIHDAIQAVRNDTSYAHRWNIHHVYTNQTGSPFIGKHLCSGGAEDFHGIVAPPNMEYSLHPNVNGQADYAAVFAEAIG
jgi:hypothetical protein